MNEYFELIEDEDLQRDEGYNRMILVCPKCEALFTMKACGNRTLFPWFGHHPTDGDCRVVSDELAVMIERKAMSCRCEALEERITSAKDLATIIERFKEKV